MYPVEQSVAQRTWDPLHILEPQCFDRVIRTRLQAWDLVGGATHGVAAVPTRGSGTGRESICVSPPSRVETSATTPIGVLRSGKQETTIRALGEVASG